MKQAHILLDSRHGADAVLLPGDPSRVGRIAKHLYDVKQLAVNREYHSVVGKYHDKSIMVCSTGIGGASMAIACEEFHNLGFKNMIRVGSSGALQENIHIGEIIIATGAVKDDGASNTYADTQFPAIPSPALICKAMQLVEEQQVQYHVGIIRSHDSFYTDRELEISQYWSKMGVLAADMETAVLYTLAAVRGFNALSILNNVVQWGKDTSDSIGEYVDGEELSLRGETNSIRLALDILNAVL